MGKLDELLADEVEIKEAKLVIKAKDFEVALKRLSTMDLFDVSKMLEVLDD